MPDSATNFTAYSTCPSLSCQFNRPFQVCQSGFDVFDCRGDLEQNPISKKYYICQCGQQATLDSLRNMSIDGRPVLLDRYRPTTCASSSEDGPCDVATSFKHCSWIDNYASLRWEPSCRLLLVDHADHDAPLRRWVNSAFVRWQQPYHHGEHIICLQMLRRLGFD